MRDCIEDIEVLKNNSIDLFCKLSSMLDEHGQEILFSYDYTMNKIYQLLINTA